MALQNSGPITMSDIAAELGCSTPYSNLGLRTLSSSAGFSTPDLFSDFYGYSAARVWTTGGALITARYALAGAGTQNAGLAFGGSPGVSCTEEYNGSNWSTGGGLITSRRFLARAGTQNAGLASGGNVPSATSATEEYNGSTWSNGGALSTARQYVANSGAGTQNAAIIIGGYNLTFPSVPNRRVLSCVEEYNGTSWSAATGLISARCMAVGAGTQNSGLAFAGRTVPGIQVYTEEYDGTSWTSGGNLITSRRCVAGHGATQDAALAFGGQISYVLQSCTEEYDGNTWATGCGLNNARCDLAGAGTLDAGLAFGGQPVACTEEYS